MSGKIANQENENHAPQVVNIRLELGMDANEVRQFVGSGPGHQPPRSYYQRTRSMIRSPMNDLVGYLRVYSPHYDFQNNDRRSVIPGDPPGDLGEIAFCYGFRNDLVLLRLFCGYGSEITRTELEGSAQMFSEYLDQCLFQLISLDEFNQSDDGRVVRHYLGFE